VLADISNCYRLNNNDKNILILPAYLILILIIIFVFCYSVRFHARVVPNVRTTRSRAATASHEFPKEKHRSQEGQVYAPYVYTVLYIYANYKGHGTKSE